MLVGTNVSKKFGKKQAVNDVDITVEPGKITALIGPSGSGKSTLLRSLALIDPPDKGQVQVHGRTYDFDEGKKPEVDPKPWPDMTIVFQDLYLWPTKTIRQNITWPMQCNSASRTSCSTKELEHLLELFSVNEFIERYPNEVSGGQRQRAAIVRALALRPTYLLLDEITSALDVEHIAVLLRHLKEISHQGTGILLITHLIGFAKRAADNVIFMDNGRIEEQGTASILSTPISDRLKKFLSLIETAS